MPGRNKRAAFQGRFHNDGAEREAAQDPVPHRKMLRQGRHTGRKLADDAAMGANILKQAVVCRRVINIHTACKHRDRRCTGGNRAAKRHGVDPGRAS